MAPAILAATVGAKRRVLVRHPVAVGVPFHRVAQIAEAARDKSAIDAGAIEGLCVAEGQDLHLRELLVSLHGPRPFPGRVRAGVALIEPESIRNPYRRAICRNLFRTGEQSVGICFEDDGEESV